MYFLIWFFICAFVFSTQESDEEDAFNYNGLTTELQDDIIDRYMGDSKGPSMQLHRVNREFWDRIASRNQVLNVDFKQTAYESSHSEKLCNVLKLKREAILNHLEVAFKNNLHDYLNCLQNVQTLKFYISPYLGMKFSFLKEMKSLTSIEAYFRHTSEDRGISYADIFQEFVRNLPDTLNSLTLSVDDQLALFKLPRIHFKPLPYFKIVSAEQIEEFPSQVYLPDLHIYFLIFEGLKITNADISVKSNQHYLGKMTNMVSKFSSTLHFDRLQLHMEMNKDYLPIEVSSFAILINQLKVEYLKLYLDYSLGGSTRQLTDILHFKHLSTVDLKFIFREQNEISQLIDSVKTFGKRELFDHVYLEFHHFEEGDLIRLAHNLAYRKLIVSPPGYIFIFCKEFHQLKDQGFSIELSKHGNQCLSLS